MKDQICLDTWETSKERLALKAYMLREDGAMWGGALTGASKGFLLLEALHGETLPYREIFWQSSDVGTV